MASARAAVETPDRATVSWPMGYADQRCIVAPLRPGV
jgi:hypothetical protein